MNSFLMNHKYNLINQEPIDIPSQYSKCIFTLTNYKFKKSSLNVDVKTFGTSPVTFIPRMQLSET